MRRGLQFRRPDDLVGEWALAAGLAAVLASFIPVIGDFIAVPTAIFAVVFGFVGIQRFEAGRAAGVAAAVTGAVLGATAGFIVFVVFAATHLSP